MDACMSVGVHVCVYIYTRTHTYPCDMYNSITLPYCLVLYDRAEAAIAPLQTKTTPPSKFGSTTVIFETVRASGSEFVLRGGVP